MSYDCIELGVCCMAFRKLVRLFILGERGVGACYCLGGTLPASSILCCSGYLESRGMQGSKAHIILLASEASNSVSKEPVMEQHIKARNTGVSTYPSSLSGYFPISKKPIAMLRTSASTTCSWPRALFSFSISCRHSLRIARMAWYCPEAGPNVSRAFSRLFDIWDLV